MLLISAGWAKVREGAGEGEEAVRLVWTTLEGLILRK
jgi:hypothetical protein